MMALIIFAPALIVLLGATAIFRGPWIERVATRCRKPTEIGKLIAGLLEHHSREWTADRGWCVISHPTGPKVWVANGASCLKATLDGAEPMIGYEQHLVPLNARDKADIWSAYEAMKNRSKQAYVDAQTAKFAKAILDRYDAENVVPFEKRA